MANRSSSIIKSIVTPSKVAGTPTPTEQLVDGDFINQNTALFPDGWGVFDFINDGPAPDGSWARSTDSQAGTYAIELFAEIATGGGDFVSPAVTGFYDTAVANKTIQARFYAKEKVAVGTVQYGVAAFYFDGANDYEWNLTAGAWIVKGSGDDNVYEIAAPTGTYAQYTNTQRTLPAGATEFWLDVVGASDTQSDSLLVDNLEWLLDGADVATNGTFEAWTSFASQTDPLNDWEFTGGQNWELDTVDPSGSDYINFTTDGGDDVVSMYVWQTGPNERGYILQSITGTPGTTVDLSTVVQTKTSDSQTGYLVLIDGPVIGKTEAWDFNLSAWAGNFDSPVVMPGTDYAMTLSGTGSFVNNNAGNVTIPDSGTLYLLLMCDDGSGAAQYAYHFKLASAIGTTLVGGSEFVGVHSTSESDATDLVSTDYALLVETTGGTPATVFGVTADGTVETRDDFLDFSGNTIEVAEPLSGSEPTTRNYIDITVPSMIRVGAMAMVGRAVIDFKSVAATTVYTVPIGYTFLPQFYSLYTTTATAPNTDSTQTLGGNEAVWDDIDSPAQLPPTTAGRISTPFTMSTCDAQVAGSVIKFNVTGADTGTALTATVFLYGVLLQDVI